MQVFHFYLKTKLLFYFFDMVSNFVYIEINLIIGENKECKYNILYFSKTKN